MYLGYAFHAAVGLFMFSNSKILSSPTDNEYSSLGSLFFASSSFAQRFNGLHNSIYIVFNVLIIASTVIYLFFFEGFVLMLKCCCSKKTVKSCLKSTDLHRRDRKYKSEDFYAELSIEWLTQHFQKAQSEEETVQKQGNLPKVDDSDTSTYKERLNQRVLELRKTIDNHLKSLFKGKEL
jgi:hypothetical protein